MQISLTQSQKDALQTFKDFLESDGQVLLLKGAAGTGKTTLVFEFLKILDERKRKCALLAPTGRAAYIIGNKTGKKATTIHRGIYALDKLRSSNSQKDSDVDAGLHARFILANNEEPESKVYIVDESSMISDAFSESEAFSFGSGKLLSDLFTFVGGRKIVFVGDYAQLPPVGMNLSPALDKDYLQDNFNCKVRELILREVMRQQAGSVILSNANKVRDAIESKTFIEFKLQQGNDTLAADSDLLIPYYHLSSSHPDRHSAIITYSNRQALQYNIAVRHHYFGEKAPRLMAGDFLMISRNNYAFEQELFNGNIVMVKACAPDHEVESKTIRVKVAKDKIESVVLRFRKATLQFNAMGNVATLNVLLLDNFIDDSHGALDSMCSRALVVDFENRLPENIKKNLAKIKQILRAKGNLSLSQQEIYDSYTCLLKHDPYYNAVVCKYGYAMTCHKAQGGEWDNVFVDMSRYGSVANEAYFRWAYTALTRASKRIWHFRSPDFNFISDLVVEPIQKSKNLKISSYSADENFLHSRFCRLKQIGETVGVHVEEDLSKSFQHQIFFSDHNDSASFTLWYKKYGYSNKDQLIKSTSEDFSEICRKILEDSYLPAQVPFSAPQRPFAEKLVDFLRSLFDEFGIKLLNITSEQYQDVFHLKSDGFAKICLYYTDKGNYTYMRFISTLGEEDKKLQSFRKQFI